MARSENPGREHGYGPLFLDFFFPIHYQLGLALEDVLRGGRLNRKQAAILWLIRTEGRAGGRIPRKLVHRALESWFDLRSPDVTKAIQGLSRAPLRLIRIVDHPESGREKCLTLTPRGERFVGSVSDAAAGFIHRLVATIDDRTLDAGARFLGDVSRRLDELRIAEVRPSDGEAPSPRRRRARQARRRTAARARRRPPARQAGPARRDRDRDRNRPRH